MPGKVLLIKSRRFTHCVAKKTKLSNGYKPRLVIGTPGCWAFLYIRCYAACATMLDTRPCLPKSVYPQSHERQAFTLFGAKTTQCVQGCLDLCRGGVAAN